MWQDYPGPYPSWDISKIIDAWRNPQPDLISICAHRGASHDGGTENSLTAFARAAKEGWESLEIDVRLTKDGKVVVFHDNGLGRLTDVSIPKGEEMYNPFTGTGYNPLVRDYNWRELQTLRLRDGYGRISLDFVRDQKLNIVVQIDFKEQAVVNPTLEIILVSEGPGVSPAEFCICKPRADWFPTPAEWEAQPAAQAALERGMRLPPITPLYEVHEGHTLDNMQAWAAAEYFVAYEIALQYQDGPFQASVDFLKSAQSHRKGQGGWFIGSDLPRGYFRGERTVWDDSAFRDAILQEGPDMPCQLVEGVGARKPGLLKFGSGPVVDQRVALAFAVAAGNNYFIADTHTDVHAALGQLGKRNITRMLR